MIDKKELKVIGSRLFYAKQMLSDVVKEARQYKEIDLTSIKEIGKQIKVFEELLMKLYNDDNYWLSMYNRVGIDKFLE